MVEEAYTLLAANEARLKGLETNESVLSYFGYDVSGFCDIVLANTNMSSALYAGFRYCSDISTIKNQVYGKCACVNDILSPSKICNFNLFKPRVF